MDKNTVWLVDWSLRTMFVTAELDKAVEFAKNKGYDVLSEEENIIVMKHKERDWTNMTISKVQLDQEIPF